MFLTKPETRDEASAALLDGSDRETDRTPAHRPWAVAAFALGFLAGGCFAIFAAYVAGAGFAGAVPFIRGVRVVLAGADPCPHWCPASTPRPHPGVDSGAGQGVALGLTRTAAPTSTAGSSAQPRTENPQAAPASAVNASAELVGEARRGLDPRARPRERVLNEEQPEHLLGRVAQLEKELARMIVSERTRLSAINGGGTRRALQHVRRMQASTAGPAHEEAVALLVTQIRRHAPKEHVDRCVRMVQGTEGSLAAGFSRLGQDWAVFHNFFAHMPWGQGFYLDLGSGDPRGWSNTAFFDWCLGWKGICVEPNPKFQRFYQDGSPARMRSCTLVKSCVSSHPKAMWVDFAMKAKAEFKDLPGEVKPLNGSSATQVRCQTLDSILTKEGVWPGDIDFVSLDFGGAALSALFCFPFQKWKVPVWLVELAKAPPELQHHFLRSGYAQVLNLLGSWPGKKCSIGPYSDSIFALMDPPLALGPMFLPGRPLQGSHPRGMCRPASSGLSCPEQLPVLVSREMVNRTGDGALFKLGECGAVLDGAAAFPGMKKPLFDLLTSQHPRQCSGRGFKA